MLLEIENLHVHTDQSVALIDGISLSLAAGDMFGLVGESGCGKSLTALSIMGLLDDNAMQVDRGTIRLKGNDLLKLSDRQMESIRGNEAVMIFQEPMTSLNPVFCVETQLVEAIQLHNTTSLKDARTRSVSLLEQVGIPSPADILIRYPHQLSGGQRQRIMIAMALACGPSLLIADEPTTALDVTVQAQILELLDELRDKTQMGVLLIAHDLGVVKQYCDTVAVMHSGRIVEHGTTADVFSNPRHPYTRDLLRTIPARNNPGKPLPAIDGQVPLPDQRPAGCAYAPRCDRAKERCTSEQPLMNESSFHRYQCWHPVQ